MTDLLRLENLHKSYPGPQGDLPVLRGVSLSLRAGDFLALRGPSGCGKSTLLSVAGGLLTPDQGQVFILENPLYGVSAAARAHQRAVRLGFVFQRFHLMPYLTVEENVMTASIALKTPVALEHAQALLGELGLGERRHHLPEQLSVGEQQRVAVARAMAHAPSVLLADEPTGNLDPDNADILLLAFQRFADRGGAVLMVTHEHAVAARAARTLTMADGALLPPRPTQP